MSTVEVVHTDFNGKIMISEMKLPELKKIANMIGGGNTIKYLPRLNRYIISKK